MSAALIEFLGLIGWVDPANRQVAYLRTPMRNDALARETWLLRSETDPDKFYWVVRHLGSDGKGIPPLTPDEDPEMASETAHGAKGLKRI